MPDGPMTPEQTRMAELAAEWQSLPDAARAAIEAGAPAAPAAVLAALTGGAVTAFPEGVTTVAGLFEGHGSTAYDQEARRVYPSQVWIDPPRPTAVQAFTVNIQVADGGRGAGGAFEASWRIVDQEGATVDLGSVTATGDTVTMTLPAQAEGNYVLDGYVNAAGVDVGSDPGDVGYRDPWSAQVIVGRLAGGEGDFRSTWIAAGDAIGGQGQSVAAARIVGDVSAPLVAVFEDLGGCGIPAENASLSALSSAVTALAGAPENLDLATEFPNTVANALGLISRRLFEDAGRQDPGPEALEADAILMGAIDTISTAVVDLLQR